MVSSDDADRLAAGLQRTCAILEREPDDVLRRLCQLISVMPGAHPVVVLCNSIEALFRHADPEAAAAESVVVVDAASGIVFPGVDTTETPKLPRYCVLDVARDEMIRRLRPSRIRSSHWIPRYRKANLALSGGTRRPAKS